MPARAPCSPEIAARSARMPRSNDRVRLSTRPSVYSARTVPGGSLIRTWPNSPAAQAHRHARGQRRDVGPPVRQRQHRRQVTGQRHRARPLRGIDDRVDAGRARAIGQRGGAAVQPPHHLRWLQVEIGQRMRGRAQLRQAHRGRGPVSHHIPDHEPGPLPGQRDDVPPVAAHHLAGSRRGTPGDLDQAGNLRRRRDQALLQRPAVPPVPGELGGVGDPGSRAPGQVGDDRDLAVAVPGPGAAAGRYQHPRHLTARGERHREERGVVGEKLPARGADPLHRHWVGPAEYAAGCHWPGIRRRANPPGRRIPRPRAARSRPGGRPARRTGWRACA